MVEIAKCKLCGSDAERYRDYLQCANEDCAVCGPSNDPDGTGWNRLQAKAPEPAPGAVRVPVAVSSAEIDLAVIANDGTMWWLAADNEWYQLPPLPQPATVETTND